MKDKDLDEGDDLVFETTLHRPEGAGTSTFARCPFSVVERFGTKARVLVAGTMNGAEFRGTLMPWGDGTHFLTVDRALREASGAGPGDPVRVVCHLDLKPRPVLPPEELKRVLEGDQIAMKAWEGLAPSHQKEFARWIEEGKKQETREARAAKALIMLCEGKRLK